ncbi:hypothetical protein X275_01355 [Marinitoga sp. 1197]|uniref:phage tail tube protein n=1 Tax=Marinitoga sp. 1197 TaxID=1428449 RepID=UPI000640E9AA|nr:phage tail tube protein [Marinitoga sp. 1197]AJW76918.1 hypothetical protein UF08_29 [Marinitoga camini virus 1]KLO24004.1 hypothetical protein X275_01355 [Marinitoga sp. 1197]
MAFTGAKSSILLGLESSFATAASLKYKLPFKSESINHKIEALKSEALLGLRGTKNVAPGKESVEGSIEMEAYPNSLGVLFYLALGKSSLDTDHAKIVPISNTEDLPSATIQVDHSGQKMLYKGIKVNNLKFSGAVGAIPNISIEVLGVDEIIGGGTEGTISEPGDEPYYFKELTLFTDNLTTFTDMYSSIEFTLNNNLDAEDYRLDGTGKRKTIDEGKFEISGTIDIIFDSTTISGEYTEYKNFTNAQLGIKLEKATGEKLTIYLPKIRFTEMTHDISGPDKIVLKANFEGLLPAAGDIIEVHDYVNTTGTY